jgi:hypothetical protein
MLLCRWEPLGGPRGAAAMDATCGDLDLPAADGGSAAASRDDQDRTEAAAAPVQAADLNR